MHTPRIVTTCGWEPISCMIFISWIRSSTSFWALFSCKVKIWILKLHYFLDLLFSFVKSMVGKITCTVQCVLNSQSHMLGSRPRGNANSTSGPNWKCFLKRKDNLSVYWIYFVEKFLIKSKMSLFLVKKNWLIFGPVRTLIKTNKLESGYLN